MACDTDASMDATKQTAAGDVLELDADPLGFGDLEFFGLFERPGLLEFLRFGLRANFFFPLESLLAERAGVACLGFPAEPSCKNLHSAPRSHLPCFQNLQIFFPLPFGLGELDRSVERPLGLLVFRFFSRGLGVSCL